MVCKSSKDQTHLFTQLIARTAKDIEVLIDSLPNEESSIELQSASLQKLEEENLEAANKLEEVVKQGEATLKEIQAALKMKLFILFIVLKALHSVTCAEKCDISLKVYEKVTKDLQDLKCDIPNKCDQCDKVKEDLDECRYQKEQENNMLHFYTAPISGLSLPE